MSDPPDEHGSIGGLEGLDAPPAFLVGEMVDARRAQGDGWHPLAWRPESLRWILEIDDELRPDRTEGGTPYGAVTELLDEHRILGRPERDRVRDLIRWADHGRATADRIIDAWLRDSEATLPRDWPDERLDEDLDDLDLQPEPEPEWDPLRFAVSGVGIG